MDTFPTITLYIVSFSVHHDEAMALESILRNASHCDIHCEDEDISILPNTPFTILWLTVPLALYIMCCRVVSRPISVSPIYTLLTVLGMAGTVYSAPYTFYRGWSNTCAVGFGQAKCWGWVS